MTAPQAEPAQGTPAPSTGPAPQQPISAGGVRRNKTPRPRENRRREVTGPSTVLRQRRQQGTWDYQPQPEARTPEGMGQLRRLDSGHVGVTGPTGGERRWPCTLPLERAPGTHTQGRDVGPGPQQHTRLLTHGGALRKGASLSGLRISAWGVWGSLRRVHGKGALPHPSGSDPGVRCGPSDLQRPCLPRHLS